MNYGPSLSLDLSYLYCGDSFVEGALSVSGLEQADGLVVRVEACMLGA